MLLSVVFVFVLFGRVVGLSRVVLSCVSTALSGGARQYLFFFDTFHGHPYVMNRRELSVGAGLLLASRVVVVAFIHYFFRF